MDYTTLSLVDVKRVLDEIVDETHALFGPLNARQLNWRADATRWSVAQCFEHLLTANRLMLGAADDALAGRGPTSMWQRLPVLPAVLGRMLIHSQSPTTTRRFKAPVKARPASSDIAAEIIQQFVDQHVDLAERVRTLDERRAARVVMTSPFIRVVTYSVLDGWRLIVAHDRRHTEQARRVTLSPGFSP
jgi:hypothetical protein